MAARTLYKRKATARVSYAPPEQSDASDAEWGGGASSTAHKARKDAPQAEETDSGDASAESSSGDEYRLGQARKKKAKRPRKKAKKTKNAADKAERAPKVKKRVGKLEAVKLVPTEILLEIFSYLSPGDLLSLSKVSKRYRSIVTGDKSRSLWRRARAKYDLPDVTSGGFTELQYAEFMFGKGCALCDRKSGIADFNLSSKLCGECRKASLVKLDELGKVHPDVHPRTKDCVIRSMFTPSTGWRSDRYAQLVDVQYWSTKLWDLEYESESEAFSELEDDRASSGHENERATAATGGAHAGRVLRQQSRQRCLYAEADSDDDALAYGQRGRIKRLVQERQDRIKALQQDGDRLRKAYWPFQSDLMHETRGSYAWWNEPNKQRLKELENCLRDEFVGASDADFEDKAYRYHPLVNTTKPLTDDGWELIRRDIFKLIKKNRRLRADAKALVAVQERQKALRPRYDKLLKAQPEKWKLFMPVFTDFLLFESVRPHWERKGFATDADWRASHDLIVEELEEWRLELAAGAHTVTAHASNEADFDSAPFGPDFEEADQTDLVAPSWLASSFVSCGYDNCREAVRILGWRGRPEGCDVLVGSLQDVLKHQRLAHNSADCLDKKRLHSDGCAPVPLAASAEVACAISALLELARLDPASATADHLDAFQNHVLRCEWETPLCGKRSHWQWRDLLNHVKVSVDAARRKGKQLELPCIMAHMRDESSDDALSEVDQSGSSSCDSDERSLADNGEEHDTGGEPDDEEQQDSDEDRQQEDEDDST